MSVKPDQLAKAIQLLKGRFSARSSVDDAMEILADRAPFSDMDDDDLEAVARAAAAEARTASAPSAPPAGRQAYGAGRPGTAGATRMLEPGVKASSPFRFVTVPDDIAMPETPDVGDHSIPLKGGFSAVIEAEWAAEGPLLIGEVNERDNVVEPLRQGATGDHVIPSATLRGLIRSAFETVSCARLGNVNLHHRYGLRDFEHPAYGEGGSPVSRVGEVKAGWLTIEKASAGEPEAWHITPCAWAHVLIDSMLTTRQANWGTSRREDWIGKSLDAKYAAIGARKDKGTREPPLYVFDKTFPFAPAPDDSGRRMVAPGGGNHGVFVFSNMVPKGGKKKFEYVFFDRPAAQPTVVKRSIVETFKRIYSKPSKNKPAPDGSWKDLLPTLEAGLRIPVFYVGELTNQNAAFFFGLTRLFKVPHHRSVGDVLKSSQPLHMPESRDANGRLVPYAPDFAENLFGYVIEPDAEKDERSSPQSVARKGRAAFGFARLENPADVLPGDHRATTVMSAPRASFSPFYLRSEKTQDPKDYSADGRQWLAGRKRYLPRRTDGDARAALATIRGLGERQMELIRQSSQGKPVSEDVKSHLRFLMPKPGAELIFRSEIRLHNVTAAEIGGLLFAITHGGDPAKPYRHMIGRAKPFGAGQMRIRTARLKVSPNEREDDRVRPPTADEIVSADGMRGFCPLPASDELPRQNASHRPFLQAFGAAMQRVKGQGAFPDVPAVREFLGASDPRETEKLIGAGTLDYLPLPDFNKLRKAVKPTKPKTNREGRIVAPPERPAEIPGERDGRLLPAPEVKPRFWV